MKSTLRLALFIVIAVSFSACIKSVEIVTTAPSNTLTGAWTLSDAAANTGHGWVSYDAGVPGLLSFYSNGNAEYDETNLTMTGNWNAANSVDGYYDQNANYFTGQHQTLEFSVADNGGGSLDLYFDYFYFVNGDEIVATYFDGKSVDRYVFDRN
jgi:hypothetical protein